MLEFLREYYIFMLILMIFSYLVPKDEYRKYIQFFIGIFMVTLILKPVLQLFLMEDPSRIYEVFETFNQYVGQMELEEGENIYEYFFFEGKRE